MISEWNKYYPMKSKTFKEIFNKIFHKKLLTFHNLRLVFYLILHLFKSTPIALAINKKITPKIYCFY